MSGGEILKSASYEEMLSSSREFQLLVNAHNNTNASSERRVDDSLFESHKPSKAEIQKVEAEEMSKESAGDQLIKQEEREIGDTGFKPYIQYLKQGNGFLFFSLSNFFFLIFLIGQLMQLYTFATKLRDSSTSRAEIYTIYSVIMSFMSLSLLFRSFHVTAFGIGASKSIFLTLLTSLFRAPTSFYDSTPMGRILSRVSNIFKIKSQFYVLWNQT